MLQHLKMTVFSLLMLFGITGLASVGDCDSLPHGEKIACLCLNKFSGTLQLNSEEQKLWGQSGITSIYRSGDSLSRFTKMTTTTGLCGMIDNPSSLPAGECKNIIYNPNDNTLSFADPVRPCRQSF